MAILDAAILSKYAFIITSYSDASGIGSPRRIRSAMSLDQSPHNDVPSGPSPNGVLAACLNCFCSFLEDGFPSLMSHRLSV